MKRVLCILVVLAMPQVPASVADQGPVPGGGPSVLDAPVFLPVDEAFRLTATKEDGKAIRLRWQVMPGYYLYRHRLSFEPAGGELGKPRMAAGESKHDEYFGDVEVYYGELVVTLPVEKLPGELTVGYQGCADAGLCYPPQQRTIFVENL